MLKRIFIGFFIFITAFSYAQEGTTSPYSFYGIGIQKFKGTAENRAMGGLSVMSDSIHLTVESAGSIDIVTSRFVGSGTTVNAVVSQ